MCRQPFTGGRIAPVVSTFLLLPLLRLRLLSLFLLGTRDADDHWFLGTSAGDVDRFWFVVVAAALRVGRTTSTS